MHHWPHAMLNTSTHDSKRSEDIRTRINVLTEMPQEWQKRFFLWSKINRPLKSQLEGRLTPTKNDEYAFYQNLIGSWPSTSLAGKERREYISRITDYMLKAIRESKEHTSWMNPNESYEKATVRFVVGSLAEANELFINDFLSFHQDISWFGMLNSLAQVLLKVASPGVPDIYQGNEIWRYCLVDPDNRRPVDFQKRRGLLNDLLKRLAAESDERSLFLQELLANLEDGRAKMATTAIALRFRNSWQEVFELGDYLPLDVEGKKQLHLCAFARKSGERMVIAAVPRLCCHLLQGKRILPLNETVWADTAILLPPNFAGIAFQNVFSQERLLAIPEEKPTLQASQVFASWPVGLLYSTT
jgi:(1->4)-alpha-D-glucan 1-alpha-D-glucosylmutase